MRQEERWFISYRKVVQEFLIQKQRIITYHNVVINTTPARWVCEHGKDHHIMYAERISPALASELTYGGAGIPAEYFDADY